MNKTEKIEHIGEGIDRLITLDLGARGIVYRLYEAARKLVNNCPLALTAAQQIIETVDAGDYIIITTGFMLPPNYIQESDGPPGAIALARALNLALKAKPIIITEKNSKEIFVAALKAAGMRNVSIKELSKGHSEGSVAIMDFPLKLNEAEKKAEEILEKYTPSLIIAVEKPGRNRKGEYHTMRGLNISRFHAKIEPLIEKASKKKILTIGIGDGGNEVGMGNIKEAVEKYVPYAKVCQCPCKGGIAAVSKVKLLVVASVSNWGAYGIEACIEALTGKRGVLHNPQLEKNVLKSIFKAGAVDGASCQNKPLVDGIPHQIHSSVISMLKALISG